MKKVFVMLLPVKNFIGSYRLINDDRQILLLKSPLILPSDFFFLLRCEIILDIEGLPNLLWSFPLYHVGHRLASQIQKRLDVQVVGRLPHTK